MGMCNHVMTSQEAIQMLPVPTVHNWASLQYQAIAEDFIYCVINWVQTFNMTLSGCQLQTEVCAQLCRGKQKVVASCGLPNGYKASLSRSPMCSWALMELQGSCEYSKQGHSWKKPTLTVFVKEPNVLLSSVLELCWKYPSPLTPSGLQIW